MKLTTDQKRRLEVKIGLAVGRSEGNVTVTTVCEIIDSMNLDCDLTKRQITAMINKSKKSYGY